MARPHSHASGRQFDGRRRALLQRLAGAAALAALSPGVTRADPAEATVALYADARLGRYGFPGDHPFGVDRQQAFLKAAGAAGLLAEVARRGGRLATPAELQRFHTPRYVQFVRDAEANGFELLDRGDTPVFPDVYDTSAWVVGAALNGVDAIMEGSASRTLQAIGGLHHAAPDAAAGFCVFNDIGVVIETLRSHYGIRRIAYIDIDVHHGDGLFYPYLGDPDLIIADVHQSGRTLYPGTGRADETGSGAARGTKLNVELDPGDGDTQFLAAWPAIEAHLAAFEPAFFLFQCGADGGAGDPLAGLNYSPAVHAHAARRLRALATRFAGGRIMAFGGGGYDRRNLGLAWSAVLREWLA